MVALKDISLVDEKSGLPLRVREHHRARRVLIRLVPGEGLRMTVPVGFDMRWVDSILEEKREWIEKSRRELEEKGMDFSGELPCLPREIYFRAADTTFFVRMVEEREKKPTVREENGEVVISGDPDIRQRDQLKLLRIFIRQKGKQYLVPWLWDTAREIGVHPGEIRVRMQKTRWGSCSEKGNINLNAKLLFLPPPLVDQLLVHELCHLIHRSHCPAFWETVSSLRPRAGEAEKSLRMASGYLPLWLG